LAAAQSRRFGVVLRGLAAVFALGYPLAVYFGLTRFGTRFAALFMLGLALLHALIRSRSERRPPWSSALIVLLCSGSFWLDDERYMLLTPVLINAALFIAFFGSLRAPQPIVERFARMQVSDLSPAEVVYCRTVTKVWSAFFVLNGGIAGTLAALGNVQLWTLYSGLISYMFVGLLAASEYTVRKYRFGRYGRGLHDRLLRALLPARTPP
jgi:uncharacterized membrane protein